MVRFSWPGSPLLSAEDSSEAGSGLCVRVMETTWEIQSPINKGDMAALMMRSDTDVRERERSRACACFPSDYSVHSPGVCMERAQCEVTERGDGRAPISLSSPSPVSLAPLSQSTPDKEEDSRTFSSLLGRPYSLKQSQNFTLANKRILNSNLHQAILFMELLFI